MICGYDLRANTGEACPECGTRYDPDFYAWLLRPSVSRNTTLYVQLLFPFLAQVLIVPFAALAGASVGAVFRVITRNETWSNLLGWVIALFVLALPIWFVAKDLARQRWKNHLKQNQMVQPPGHPPKGVFTFALLYIATLVVSFMVACLGIGLTF